MVLKMVSLVFGEIEKAKNSSFSGIRIFLRREDQERDTAFETPVIVF